MFESVLAYSISLEWDMQAPASDASLAWPRMVACTLDISKAAVMPLPETSATQRPSLWSPKSK